MRHVYNTNFYSMENNRSNQYQQNPTHDFTSIMMHTVGEDDLVIGDPTDFNIKDPNNDFDHGWDLDEDDHFLFSR